MGFEGIFFKQYECMNRATALDLSSNTNQIEVLFKNECMKCADLLMGSKFKFIDQFNAMEIVHLVHYFYLCRYFLNLGHPGEGAPHQPLWWNLDMLRVIFRCYALDPSVVINGKFIWKHSLVIHLISSEIKLVGKKNQLPLLVLHKWITLLENHNPNKKEPLALSWMHWY